MFLAALSVTLFVLRFLLLVTKPNVLQKKWLKITPHIIDTLLFSLGIYMMIKLSLYPGEVTWMTEKLLAVVAYIFTGYFTLKLARNNLMRWFGFFGALGWVVLVARIAITKSNFLL